MSLGVKMTGMYVYKESHSLAFSTVYNVSCFLLLLLLLLLLFFFVSLFLMVFILAILVFSSNT